VLTTDGTSNTAKSGGLYVLNARGHIVAHLGAQQLINGPWGLAINERGPGAQLFVSNVFDGTITRLDVTFGNGGIAVQNAVKIGSGYGFGPDSAAVVVGPAGLAYDAARDTLFVASEQDDTIFALHGAGKTQTDLGTGAVVYQDKLHLHGPLGLIFAPNGNLLVANADPAVSQDPNEPSEIVEFTRSGRFVRQYSVDPNLGSAFALGIENYDDAQVFAYVDDFLSTCTILNLSAGMS
jgi:DNA-binding beta-propeller fold protein YncE